MKHLDATLDGARRSALERIKARLAQTLGRPVGFPLVASPIVLEERTARQILDASRQIIEQLARPELLGQVTSWIGPLAPRGPLGECLLLDFALVRGPDGHLQGRLVELQGFPSLYAFGALLGDAWNAEMRRMSGDVAGQVTFGGGMDDYLSRLGEVVVGGCPSEQVILLELNPEHQPTAIDFSATRHFLGVDALDPALLVVDGRGLFRRDRSRATRVRRVYQRIVPEDLTHSGRELPFRHHDDVDVDWVPHPDWYFVWSKLALPALVHSAVPKAWRLCDWPGSPSDEALAGLVLKPLFSYGGRGVRVGPTRADVARIPEQERSNWLLQERVSYAPVLTTEAGEPRYGELRILCLRSPGKLLPEPAINLVRVSSTGQMAVSRQPDDGTCGATIAFFSVT